MKGAEFATAKIVSANPASIGIQLLFKWIRLVGLIYSFIYMKNTYAFVTWQMELIMRIAQESSLYENVIVLIIWR